MILRRASPYVFIMPSTKIAVTNVFEIMHLHNPRFEQYWSNYDQYSLGVEGNH